MAPINSFLVDKKIYENESEFFCQFAPRIHKQDSLANDACTQCQIDLSTFHDIGTLRGCMNLATGNWVSLALPECLPERLPLIAYSYEMAFVLDEIVDKETDVGEVPKEKDFILNSIEPNGDTVHSKVLMGREGIVSKMAAHFLGIDPVQGKVIVDSWTAFAMSRRDTHDLNFQNIAEYMEFRNAENGWVLTTLFARFACDIVLTEAELTSIETVQAPILTAVTLTNDYFSWDKEYQLHIQSGQSTPLLNAVYFIKCWDRVSDANAKVKLRNMICGLEKGYSTLKSEYLLKNPTASQNILKWFGCLEEIAAGNMLWSISAPRYNMDAPNPYPVYYQKRCQQGISFFPNSIKHQKILPGFFMKPQSEFVSNGHTNGVVKPATNGRRAPVGNSTADSSSPSESSVALQDLRLQPMDEKPVSQASTYIQSMPSKNVRKIMISALNTWYHVPSSILPKIQSVVDLLHNGSLMIDDVQDGSTKRRGLPAAHCIFGVAQTINSANLLFVKAISQAHAISPATLDAFIDELHHLHIGQGYDLLWTYHGTVPSEEEYLQMIDRKTGGLFRIATRTMKLHSTENRKLDLSEFVALMGRYFQIRDDYQNLNAIEYFETKGFCEDLDEGKMSFPLIHAMSSDSGLLKSLLESRKQKKFMSPEEKTLVVKQLEANGSLAYTLETIKSLQQALWTCLHDLEVQTQTPNWLLRILLYKLAV